MDSRHKKKEEEMKTIEGSSGKTTKTNMKRTKFSTRMLNQKDLVDKLEWVLEYAQKKEEDEKRLQRYTEILLQAMKRPLKDDESEESEEEEEERASGKGRKIISQRTGKGSKASRPIIIEDWDMEFDELPDIEQPTNKTDEQPTNKAGPSNEKRTPTNENKGGETTKQPTKTGKKGYHVVFGPISPAPLKHEQGTQTPKHGEPNNVTQETEEIPTCDPCMGTAAVATYYPIRMQDAFHDIETRDKKGQKEQQETISNNADMDDMGSDDSSSNRPVGHRDS